MCSGVQLSPGLVPVLSNGMGEQGAFEDGGTHVPAHGATFLLTWRAPANVMAEVSGHLLCRKK